MLSESDTPAGLATLLRGSAHVSVGPNITPEVSDLIGNESAPKIMINNAINLFF